MVRFAPSCLAKTQTVILVVSDAVTPIKRSARSIFASFKIAIDVASPFMTLISKWLSA